VREGGCGAWEAEIAGRVAARIWGITDDELRAIQVAIADSPRWRAGAAGMSPRGTASATDFGEIRRTEGESEDK